MAGNVAYGQYQLELHGLDLNYGAAAAMVQAHVAVNNRFKQAVPAHTVEER